MRSFSIKSFMRGWLAIVALLLLASCGKSDSNTGSVSTATGLAGSQELVNTFAATLTGAEETPPTQSAARGSGTLVVDSDNRTAIATVTTTGIQGAAAHIHEGAPGVAGPIIFPLNETSPGSGIWTSKITLTEAQFNSLQAGNFYFNVHSAAFPNGEIRGQILLQKQATSTNTAMSEQTVITRNDTNGGSATSKSTATSRTETTGTGTSKTDTTTVSTANGNAQSTSTLGAFTAALRGSQETPPNSSTALGAGAAVVDATTRSLVVAVATKGITATEAHVHLAPPGVPGPVIIPLVETSPGSGIWIAKATLTEAQYNALVAGNLYLNVHSAAFPEGEIRGQLLPVLQ